MEELIGLTDAPVLQSIGHPRLSYWTSLANLRREVQPSMFQPVLKEYKGFFAYWKVCGKTDEFKAI